MDRKSTVPTAILSLRLLNLLVFALFFVLLSSLLLGLGRGCEGVREQEGGFFSIYKHLPELSHLSLEKR